MNSKTLGLFAGIFVCILVIILPTPEGAKPEAMRAAGVTLLMAIWWITEALPISATALVPLALFPMLGILDADKTAENYGHSYVLMLLGGFFIAKAIEMQNLHKRIALLTIKTIGSNRQKVILSFMIATAFLSMWIANVAVVLLMLPIATAIITKEEETDEQNSRFGLALMLAIAYAASVGGTATLIGTPPNLVFAGIIKSLYPKAPEISFFQWMLIGVPMVIVLLPFTWLYLLKYFKIKGKFSGSHDIVERELKALGSMTKAEMRVLMVFIFTALGWVFRKDFNFGSFELPGWASLMDIDEYVHDSTVAIIAALALFITPTGNKEKDKQHYLLDWKSAESVPWGVVIIVGGGYAIANGFAETGLALWLGNQITFVEGMSAFLVLLIVVFFITFLTEVNSNTATANIFLPVLATVAVVNQTNPLLLMIPATFACSCAFCLPSGTGTNAVIFGSGRVTIPEMAKAGLWMNFISIVIVTLVVYLVAVPVLGIGNEVPVWAK